MIAACLYLKIGFSTLFADEFDLAYPIGLSPSPTVVNSACRIGIICTLDLPFEWKH